VIVCDTGPLVAAADRDDQHNRACTDLFTGLHLARRAILVPAPVVAEVGYLLGRAGGAKIEAAFLRSIVQETLTVVDLELVDYERMAELVEVIRRLPVGTTDAAVVAVAERLGITRSRRSIAVTSMPCGLGMPTASPCCPDRWSCPCGGSEPAARMAGALSRGAGRGVNSRCLVRPTAPDGGARRFEDGASARLATSPNSTRSVTSGSAGPATAGRAARAGVQSRPPVSPRPPLPM
jgi:uncharacterized protein